MTVRRLILIVVTFVVLTGAAFAQTDPDPEGPVNWFYHLAVFLNAVAIPLVVKLLKPLWNMAPQWLQGWVPGILALILPALTAIASAAIGFPIGLEALLAIFGGAGLASSMAFKMGAKHG